jgi:ATP-dependent Clp protease ATP-binding subunit ClpA
MDGMVAIGAALLLKLVGGAALACSQTEPGDGSEAWEREAATRGPRFSIGALSAIKRAKEEAERLNGPVEGGHLLIGLLGTPEDPAATLLRESGADFDRVTDEFRRVLAEQPAGTHELGASWSAEGRRTLDQASAEAREHPVEEQVKTLHLLLAMLREANGSGVRILRALGADPDEVGRRAIALLRENTG